MPYNIDLEKRLDALTPNLGQFTKKRMFGGIGYLVNGNMAYGIHRQALIIRVSERSAEELLRQDFVSVFSMMTSRPMAGWLLISPDGVKTDRELLRFLKLSSEYSTGLPKK